MDVLSDVLDTLRLRGTLYFSTELRRPWGIRVPAYKRVSRFHLVVRGSLWVRVTGLPDPLLLETGDMILVPHGAEHILVDSATSPVHTVDEVVAASGFTGRGALVYGGDDEGAPTRLVCGHFEYDEGMEHALLSQLPQALVVRWDDEVRDTPLEDAFRFMTREVLDARPGHEAVVRRLSEVLFFQVVRAWAARATSKSGLLAALGDARLAAALEAMHAEPAYGWTLEDLSRRAAMGRSAFAERFRDVMGETPMRYLTAWRVQHAKRLLAESRLTRDRIAALVGYDSATSMSRVFLKLVGTTPGAFRRAARARSEEHAGVSLRS